MGAFRNALAPTLEQMEPKFQANYELNSLESRLALVYALVTSGVFVAAMLGISLAAGPPRPPAL